MSRQKVVLQLSELIQNFNYVRSGPPRFVQIGYFTAGWGEVCTYFSLKWPDLQFSSPRLTLKIHICKPKSFDHPEHLFNYLTRSKIPSQFFWQPPTIPQKWSSEFCTCILPVVDKVHRSSTWVKVQIRIIKYYSSKSKSTAFSILLEWKYKSTRFLCT